MGIRVHAVEGIAPTVIDFADQGLYHAQSFLLVTTVSAFSDFFEFHFAIIDGIIQGFGFFKGMGGAGLDGE